MGRRPGGLEEEARASRSPCGTPTSSRWDTGAGHVASARAVHRIGSCGMGLTHAMLHGVGACQGSQPMGLAQASQPAQAERQPAGTKEQARPTELVQAVESAHIADCVVVRAFAFAQDATVVRSFRIVRPTCIGGADVLPSQIRGHGV